LSDLTKSLIKVLFDVVKTKLQNIHKIKCVLQESTGLSGDYAELYCDEHLLMTCCYSDRCANKGKIQYFDFFECTFVTVNIDEPGFEDKIVRQLKDTVLFVKRKMQHA
jgi:hypothetical protein